MKFTIQQSILLPILQSVSRSSGNRTTLPVLSNVLIQADKDSIQLSCTNLEIGVLKSAIASVSEPGSITIPVKMLLEVISSLNPGEIIFESTEDQLKLTSSNFNANFNGISATEFPSIPLTQTDGVKIQAQTLLQSLPQITFAAAVDEGRPVLTGILTQIKPTSLEMVATDGFRLAHKTLPLKSTESLTSLIPRKTFEEVVRLIAEEDDPKEVEITTSENQNQIIFKLSNTQISSRLIEGTFPSWEKILPTNFITSLTINRQELLRSVKLASIFAKDNANVVKLDIGSNKILLTSEAKELGGQETTLDCLSEGETLTIAFNSRFLTDALANCPSEEVKIAFSGALLPSLITPVGEQGLEYVVMPVRLN